MLLLLEKVAKYVTEHREGTRRSIHDSNDFQLQDKWRTMHKISAGYSGGQPLQPCYAECNGLIHIRNSIIIYK